MPDVELVGGPDDGKEIEFSDAALDNLRSHPQPLQVSDRATYELREDGRLWHTEQPPAPTDRSKGAPDG